MDFARAIKERVSMTDAAERYGLQTNRSGFCCCPFHGEKTPSMKIYGGDRGFCCFGCGEAGDVIDFVKKMFSLTFQQAIERINDDFCLGLDIGRTMTDRERREAARADFERRKKVEKERRMRQEADKRYFDALNEWIRLDTQKREFRPLQGETTLHPKFLEALQHIGLAEYRLEQAEIERYITNVNK